MNKNTNRPMDVVTCYNELIMATYNNFNNKINSDDITFNEQVNFVSMLTELYKLENEKLGLSFYDKEGNRYINFLNAWPMILKDLSDDAIDTESYFLLFRLRTHYFEKYKAEMYSNPMDEIAPREGAILNLLFTNNKSREILERNKLTYGMEVKYKSEEDEIYCKAVLDLIKEITIRSVNYIKYICGNDYSNSTDEDVYKMYQKLYLNYLDDIEYIDKTKFQKLVYKLQYNKKLKDRYKKK